MNSNKKKEKILLVLIILIFITWAVAPVVVENSYYIHVLFMVTLYAILAASLNIAVGLTGLSNMSHASFFGIGAYVAALLALNFNVPFYLNLFCGALVSMGFGIVLGAPTLRLKSFYLALVTIGFGQVVRIVELNWISLTNGPMGLPGIPAASLGGKEFTPEAYIWYGLLILCLTLFTTHRMIKSKIGRALVAIKNDEIVARALGVNVTYYKILAFAMSAFFAGMAGTIYAHYITFVSPDSFTAADSTTLLCMVILGGTGTLFGPVLGAIILILTPEILRFVDLYRILLVGILMIVGIIAQECHWGTKIEALLRRRFGRVTEQS